MQKEELLHLHMLLVHVRKYYESTTGEDVPTDQYNALHISPVHIHKNKVTHKKAILTLGDEIVHHIRAHHNPYIEYHADFHSERIATEH
ncbi:hypothetical protein HL657_06305 [Methanoculleus sp. YWC-01]|uniref:Metal-binding protein n=3 Tax=Methanoculleus TaxID=45989 RepID=A0ABU3Z2H6_9EURY|nr:MULTISPECIES: UPF0058 family protein [unclassified Methanoculleus]MDV4342790.1 hypothetical protein [Methanoculleus sp. YWC-01]